MLSYLSGTYLCIKWCYLLWHPLTTDHYEMHMGISCTSPAGCKCLCLHNGIITYANFWPFIVELLTALCSNTVAASDRHCLRSCNSFCSTRVVMAINDYVTAGMKPCWQSITITTQRHWDKHNVRIIQRYLHSTTISQSRTFSEKTMFFEWGCSILWPKKLNKYNVFI